MTKLNRQEIIAFIRMMVFALETDKGMKKDDVLRWAREVISANCTVMIGNLPAVEGMQEYFLEGHITDVKRVPSPMYTEYEELCKRVKQWKGTF